MAEQGLAIPPRYRSAFVALAGASQGDVTRLAKALKGDKQRLATSALAKHVEESLPNVGGDQSKRIVEAILSLMVQERARGVSREDIAGAVVTSDSIALEEPARTRLESHLVELLGVETLKTALKAHDVMTEHSHVFSQARLFSDLRPVFGEAATEAPLGLVITETLKVEYFNEAMERAAFFVALDHLDLEHLKQVIERGIEKTKTLREHVVSNGMPLWEYETEVGDAEPD